MSHGEWRSAARAAGFDVDALTVVAELLALGVVAVDGPPIEALPGYWLIPGFVPYGGQVILAAADRRRSAWQEAGDDLASILAQAVEGGPGSMPEHRQP